MRRIRRVLNVLLACALSVSAISSMPSHALAIPPEYAAAGVVEGRGVPENYYLVVADQDGVELGVLVRDAGGRVLASIPPDRVLATFPGAGEALFLKQDFRVRSVAPLSDVDDAWHVDALDREEFSMMRMALSRPAVETRKPPLVRDFFRHTRIPGAEVELRAPAFPPDFMDAVPAPRAVSVPVLPAWPMKNTIAVTIIMPESDGSIDTNRENWTTSLENTVVNEITSGLPWWPAKAQGYGVDMDFKFYTYRPSENPDAVRTGYEPITRPSDEEGLWISQIMNNLGYDYPYYNYTEAVDSFNAYMKGYAGAAGAVTIFVVNSKNDSDGMFPDGYFAYAHWGGPLIMMTTDNSSYGINEMSSVVVHEMGHSFYAVDEYYSPGYATCSCDDGYNGCKNRNCDHNCGMNVPCMMRYNEDALCADTVCHIGWVCQCSTGECCDGCGYRPGSYICRKLVDDCDITEFCSGGDTACPKDTFRASTYKCRSSAGDCDVVEYCNGSSAACPSDVVKASGTICRDSTGDCDAAEKCDGASGACPANVFLDSTHVCRESGGECDGAEYCTGSSAACPADDAGSSMVCREATGPCDATEYCDAKTGGCPEDSFAPSTTVCRASTGPCDAAEYCTGDSGDCPVDEPFRSDVECRAAAGACDVAEMCDGTSASCPVDMIRGQGFECRAAAGTCDVAEVCTGASTKCPEDAIKGEGEVCREAVNDCDLAEKCTGSSAYCPPNAIWGAGHACDDGMSFTSGDSCTSEGECVGIRESTWGCTSSARPGSGAAAFAFMLAAAVASFALGRRRVRRGR